MLGSPLQSREASKGVSPPTRAGVTGISKHRQVNVCMFSRLRLSSFTSTNKLNQKHAKMLCACQCIRLSSAISNQRLLETSCVPQVLDITLPLQQSNQKVRMCVS